MKNNLLLLSLAGLLFSGYMSFYKLFTDICAFGETCPYFFGIPACYIGFILFLSLFIMSLLLFFNKLPKRIGLLSMSIDSFLGIIFAGFYTTKELPLLFEKGLGAYVFGLPTCALGMIFFIMVFVFAIYYLIHLKNELQ